MSASQTPDFESAAWTDDPGTAGTPAITPGLLSNAAGLDAQGLPSFEGITHGVHWSESSYPAWTGQQPETAPFGIEHIAAMVNQTREVFGFQKDAAVNVFELLMSQLDSRSSRTSPITALHSLHSDYISGTQANFRKWYFAAGMDQIDRDNRRGPRTHGNSPGSSMSFVFEFEGKDRPKTGSELEEFDEDECTLQAAECAWNAHHAAASPNEKLVDLLIYLFCWTEANQVRFMPECLAFLVKCARDYYYARFPAHPLVDRDVKNLRECFFLDMIITPIYNAYCSFNFVRTDSGTWIRREGDHKDFIGYDDMNQLFWYRQGIEKLRTNTKSLGNDISTGIRVIDSPSEMPALISMPQEDWFLALATVPWDKPFAKTYRELRSWIHNITNFSRIWILHASAFWFYTAFNAPSLYTVGYNYMNPKPPRLFVRWSIVSLGGLFGPFLSLLGLYGEWRFVPRKYAGANPILARFVAVLLLTAFLAVPVACNLALNPWTGSHDIDLMPANVIAFVSMALALVYTTYFSFQPLNRIFIGKNVGHNSKETDKINRRYLANKLFTASFPQRSHNDTLLSWIMCLLIFIAKLTESYFFLTLSVKAPIRELGIMDLEGKCIGEKYLVGAAVCRWYPKIILAGVLFTDMTLFFLDTYLWYVILSTLISVSIALKQGTSVWTPWRHVYSQLSQRISTKLLAPSTNVRPYDAKAYAVRVVWNSIVECMYRNNLLCREQALRLIYVCSMTQEPRFFTMEEDGKVLDNSSGYQSSGAQRRISFFAQSLSTTMPPAVPVQQMPTFTVMIPHYKEKILLSLSETIKADSGAKVTVLEYLQRLYPQEWNNYIQALQYQKEVNAVNSFEKMSSFNISPSPRPFLSTKFTPSSPQGILKPQKSFTSPLSEAFIPNSMRSPKSHQLAIQKLGFSTLDPNDTYRTRLWCSERTQTLYRTLRGFSNYTRAIEILDRAERCETPEIDKFQGIEQYPRIADVSRRKFRLLVSMQLYAQFTSEQLTQVENILSYVPELVVSYYEQDFFGVFYSCVFDSTCPLLENGRRKPKMRIKLSGNPILGDGKSDNQNIALPFYRGEYIQLVDANQDNYLEECLKIRNVLREFENTTEITNGFQTERYISPKSPRPHRQVTDLEAQRQPFTEASILSPSTAPIAIVGAREYIFSENIGVLGDVAAGKEQTFGNLFSRTLSKIGAKLHYGHPDFLNGIFMSTRGGVSKGQRGLHLNEDIYAGMTAVQRGGQIRHSEYFQCGKGRDLGFVSILNFTAKIGAGMGEQMLSREYFYMGTQLPFDRFISFYYAHPGFHINNACIMLSLHMLLTVVLWLNSIASVCTVCKYDKTLDPTSPHRPAGCTNILPLLDWVSRCIVSIFLVFFVSLCPLLFQELTEKGLLRSLCRIFRHIGSLSMLFEVFVCRIYAKSFWADMNLGGAKYVATGRGLATSRLSFYHLYTGYNLEIACGLKIAGILIFSGSILWSPGYLWFWTTAFSFCFCPVLYNPHQFALTEFFLDYRALILWFWNATSTSSSKIIGNASWGSFNQESRERLTGVKNRQISSQSTRPAFRNAVFSEAGIAFLNTLCFLIPYVYIGVQKTSHNQTVPETSPLLRSLLVSLVPVAINSGMLIIGLLVSMVVHGILRTVKHANAIAQVVRVTSLLGLIFSYWILSVLEARRFAPTLLGVMFVASLHHLFHILLVILIVRRQRHQTETNDPWWTGQWFSQGKSKFWRVPLVITEEYLVKIVETLQYAYDFLLCHLILAVQAPLLFVPWIDKLHTLFLLWLRPGVVSDAAKSSSVNRKHYTVQMSRIFCAVFILIVSVLVILLSFPFYAPMSWIDNIESILNTKTLWS